MTKKISIFFFSIIVTSLFYCDDTTEYKNGFAKYFYMLKRSCHKKYKKHCSTERHDLILVTLAVVEHL